VANPGSDQQWDAGGVQTGSVVGIASAYACVVRLWCAEQHGVLVGRRRQPDTQMGIQLGTQKDFAKAAFNLRVFP